MLIDIKDKIREEEVAELLEAAIFPDPERIEQAKLAYENDAAKQLYGYEDQGDLIGIVGFSVDAGSSLTIHHLAVHPECRGAGYGRGLVLELIELKKPREIVVETDEDTVDFYRNIGFTISSLGETYPGTERFRCHYSADLEDGA
nr:GNAT family N-acetyltransferase [Paenibacillus sp. FJAT-26967]